METDFDFGLESATNVKADVSRKSSVKVTRLLPSQVRHLELLSHLASYSELLVVVSGPEGAGKTVIAQGLAAQREGSEETLFLTASIMLGMPSILSAIAGVWDMPNLTDDGSSAREAIRNEALERYKQGNGLLIIIDQAEQLDSETLNDIAHFALLAPQAISIALFGCSGFERVFRSSPAQAPIHTVLLEPLTLEEVDVLLTEVLGIDGQNPFTDNELMSIYQQSGGWPRALIQAAENHLLGSERNVKTATTGFPMRNILGLAVIATVVIMLGIYQLGGDEVESASVEPLVSSLVTEKSLDAAAFPAEAELNVAPPPVSGTSDFNYPSEPEPDSINPVPLTPTVAKSEPIAPAIKPVETVPEAAKALSKQIATPKKLATPANTADESALLAAKGGYIVQLLGSYQEASADGFKAQWQAKVTGNVYRYKTSHKGRDWYVVVAGVYSSRGEATAAVNLLPIELRKQSPWIRPVSAVQDVLR